MKSYFHHSLQTQKFTYGRIMKPVDNRGAQLNVICLTSWKIIQKKLAESAGFICIDIYM